MSRRLTAPSLAIATLVLIALCALAPKASGMPSAWPQVTVAGSAEMRSGGGQLVATTATPGSGHHYTGHQIGQRAAIQPRALPGSGHHYTGHQIGQQAAIQPREISIQPNDTFDWADASVGAGITFVLGLLVAGGALVSSGRIHGKVSAGKTRS